MSSDNDEVSSSEYRYMIRRTLLLLLGERDGSKLARTTKNRKKPAEPITQPLGTDSTPDAGVIARPALQTLNALINLLHWLRRLHSRALPRIRELEQWHETSDERPEPQGKINWQKTLELWHAEKTPAPSKIVEEPSTETRNLSQPIAMILLEATVHADVLGERMRTIEGDLKPVVGKMISEVQARVQELRVMLGKPWLATESIKLGYFVDRVRELFERELGSSQWEENGRPSRYESAVRQQSTWLSKTCRVGPLLNELLSQRSAYLRGEAWLVPGGSLEHAESQPNYQMFELWCFMEFVRAACESGERHVVQNALLQRARPVAPMSIDDTHHVLFDISSNSFEDAVDVHEDLARAMPSAALPLAHPEWFVLDRERPEESIVIDTKKRVWDSGEALKVLGYMNSFGIRRGVAIFHGELGKAMNDASSQRDGVFHFPCPDPARGSLWILRLRPSPEHQDANEAAMTQLFGELFPDEQHEGLQPSS